MFEDLEDQIDQVGRDFEILGLVADHQPIGIQNLSDQTGYPVHQVRYSLRVLEDEGLIEPTDRGATLTETAPDLVEEYAQQLSAFIDRLDALTFDPNT